MARSGAARKIEEGDWPAPSAPAHGSRVCVYFWKIGGQVMAWPLREKWQGGTMLKAILRDCVVKEESDRFVTYLVVTERDTEGEPTRGRRYGLRVEGGTINEMTAMARDTQMPWACDNAVRAARGEISRTYAEFESDIDPATAADRKTAVGGGNSGAEKDRGGTASGFSGQVSRGNAGRRVGGTPVDRKSREGLVTVTQLCEEGGVNGADVRAALRKRKIEKPVSGWAYADGDPMLGTIMDIIKMVKKGGK